MNKKIIIFILISAVLVITCNLTYASDNKVVDVSYYDEIISKLGNKPYYFVKSEKEQYYALFVYPCNSHYTSWNYETDEIYFYIKNNVLTCRNATKNEETSHFADYSYNGTKVNLVHSCWAYGGTYFIDENIKGNREIYTSKPIYKDVNKSEIFFFKRPPTLVTITEITKVEQIVEIITKIITMIMPAGLVILSIGLLIYLIKYWILRTI